MMKNTAEVKILGQTYRICSDESAADMARLAARVTEDISRSIESNSGAGSLTAAALAAMDYLSRLEKAERELSLMKSGASENSDETESLRARISELSEENGHIKAELESAQSQIGDYKARIVVLEDKLSLAKRKGAKKK